MSVRPRAQARGRSASVQAPPFEDVPLSHPVASPGCKPSTRGVFLKHAAPTNAGSRRDERSVDPVFANFHT